MNGYTTEELCTLYRDAKDKNKQIGILADMASTSKEQILQMLNENGLITGTPKAKEVKRTMQKYTAEQNAEIHRLYQQGLDAGEIAERMGMDRDKIKKKIINDIARGVLNRREDANPKVIQKTQQAKPKTTGNLDLFRTADNLRSLLAKEESLTLVSMGICQESQALSIGFYKNGILYALKLEASK